MVGLVGGGRGGFLLAGYNPATGAFARGGSRQYGGLGNSRLVYRSPYFIFRFGENKPWFGVSQPPGLEKSRYLYMSKTCFGTTNCTSISAD